MTDTAPGEGATDGSAAAAVDWANLRSSAREIMTHAYAPYSGYPVGAAALAAALPDLDVARNVPAGGAEDAATRAQQAAQMAAFDRALREVMEPKA